MILFRFIFIFLLLLSPCLAEPTPEGVWKVDAIDDYGSPRTTWRAKLVLYPENQEEYPPIRFKGYFDWRGSNNTGGREYIVEGLYDYEERILTLKGTELENADKNIKTSIYTVKMNIDANELQNGSWNSCRVIPGQWEAVKASEPVKKETPKKESRVRKDIPNSECSSGQCQLAK
jgi:hypothetical protein